MTATATGRPCLYLLCGMAGAGKTTLAKRLETELSAVRLCPDEWIAPLLIHAEDRAEMDRLRVPIEQLQWNTAQRLLQLGVKVILENGFWAREERLEYLRRGQAMGCDVFLHYLDVPRNELVDRIEARNRNLPFDTFRVAPDEIDFWLEAWFVRPDEAELQQYSGHHVHPVT